MAAFLRDALAAHAGQLGLAKNDVLCRTSKGTLFRRDYYNPEIWKPALGVPISEVSRRLGHKSITTAVDLYGHLVPEAASQVRTLRKG